MIDNDRIRHIHNELTHLGGFDHPPLASVAVHGRGGSFNCAPCKASIGAAGYGFSGVVHRESNAAESGHGDHRIPLSISCATHVNPDIRIRPDDG